MKICGKSHLFIDRGAPCVKGPDHEEEDGNELHLTANGFTWQPIVEVVE